MEQNIINQRLKRIRHVALDMDGTIYNGSTLFPFTVDFLNRLKRLDIGYSFLTNNPTRSVKTYVSHLQGMGIPAVADDLYTSALATIDFLRMHHPNVKKLFIVGTPDMIGEFETAGFFSIGDMSDERPDAIIVAFDTTLTYTRLCRAAWWIAAGVPYIATNPDRVCPHDEPTILIDCGSLCAALEHATGRAPDTIIGKPAPRMLEGIMERYNLRPDEIAMVGDRLYTDIAMAVNTHAFGVLVLSGETNETELAGNSIQPDLVVSDIGELGWRLELARN